MGHHRNAPACVLLHNPCDGGGHALVHLCHALAAWHGKELGRIHKAVNFIGVLRKHLGKRHALKVARVNLHNHGFYRYLYAMVAVYRLGGLSCAGKGTCIDAVDCNVGKPQGKPVKLLLALCGEVGVGQPLKGALLVAGCLRMAHEV